MTHEGYDYSADRYNFYLTETDFEDDDENEVVDQFGIYDSPTDEDVEDDEDDEELDEDTTSIGGYRIVEDDEDIDLTNKVI